MKIHFGHRVGKYVLNYPVTFCRDRPAAARRCACYYICFKIGSVILKKMCLSSLFERASFLYVFVIVLV